MCIKPKFGLFNLVSPFPFWLITLVMGHQIGLFHHNYTYLVIEDAFTSSINYPYLHRVWCPLNGQT